MTLEEEIWQSNYYNYEKYTYRIFKNLQFKNPSKEWLANIIINNIIKYLDNL